MKEKSSIKIMSGKGKVKVVLYTKPGCPLCERTEGILLLLSGLVDIDVEYIDITSDYSLFQKYQYNIHQSYLRYVSQYPKSKWTGPLMSRQDVPERPPFLPGNRHNPRSADPLVACQSVHKVVSAIQHYFPCWICWRHNDTNP